MKRIALPVLCFLVSCLLSGCGLMEDAFKAGVIFTIIIVLIIGLIIWLARMLGKFVMKKYDLTFDEPE